MGHQNEIFKYTTESYFLWIILEYDFSMKEQTSKSNRIFFFVTYLWNLQILLVCNKSKINLVFILSVYESNNEK
jgi:hypothetical protein